MVYTSRLVVKTVYMPLIRTLRYVANSWPLLNIKVFGNIYVAIYVAMARYVTTAYDWPRLLCTQGIF